MAALGAGASSTGSLNVTIPSATPLGVYFLLACADDSNSVFESDETNEAFNLDLAHDTVQFGVNYHF